MTCLPCALVLSCAGIFFTPVSTFFGVAKATFTLYFSIVNLAMMVTLPVWGKVIAQRLEHCRCRIVQKQEKKPGNINVQI